jgi:hypothetical protein
VSREQLIVECAERCERALRCEAAAVACGDLECAAIFAERAEVDSYLAFSQATEGRVFWMVGQ